MAHSVEQAPEFQTPERNAGLRHKPRCGVEAQGATRRHSKRRRRNGDKPPKPCSQMPPGATLGAALSREGSVRLLW